MEISRPSLAASGGRSVGTAYTGAARAAAVEQPAPAAARPRVRSSDQVERVVQGELLQRENTRYQSTRAFIDERAFDQSLSGQREAMTAPRSRAAISLYLNNAGREATAAPEQGRSINYFV
jgi:hypothetical protein